MVRRIDSISWRSTFASISGDTMNRSDWSDGRVSEVGCAVPPADVAAACAAALVRVCTAGGSVEI
eukprot:3509593-Pleurochrysis_carterae.AAC.1